MEHVGTAPYYPQSNGKLERWHYSVKGEAIRPACPTSLEQARRLVAEYVQHYNCVRLHSAHSYIAPMDFLSGLAPQIWAESDRRWEQDRSLRAKHRAQLRGQPSQPATSSAELACA